MEFVRKRKRGQNKKVRKTWFSEEGYRIVWRKEVCGVRVPTRFQACVRTVIPYSDGQPRQMWEFVNHKRRLIKTLQAAQDECEKHKLLWTRACEVTGIRVLKELFGGKLPLGLPLWARKNMDRRLYGILMDNRPLKYREDEEDETCTESSQPASDASGPGGPTRTSGCSASPKEAVSAIRTPASPAEGKGRSTTPRTRHARLKAASTGEPSAAPPAEAVAKGRKRRAARRTSRSSKSANKRKRNTTDSPASDAKPSRGSRKKKSRPSES
jgi:hypothetical protein